MPMLRSSHPANGRSENTAASYKLDQVAAVSVRWVYFGRVQRYTTRSNIPTLSRCQAVPECSDSERCAIRKRKSEHAIAKVDAMRLQQPVLLSSGRARAAVALRAETGVESGQGCTRTHGRACIGSDELFTNV
ncbi:hypothetical protein MRX96_031359 [Rhipicephalus microplus]